MDLQEYQFTIRHRAGHLHTNADALSRLPFEAEKVCSSSSIGASDPITISPTLNLKQAQHEDPQLATVIQLKRSGKGRPEFNEWSQDTGTVTINCS